MMTLVELLNWVLPVLAFAFYSQMRFGGSLNPVDLVVHAVKMVSDKSWTAIRSDSADPPEADPALLYLALLDTKRTIEDARRREREAENRAYARMIEQQKKPSTDSPTDLALGIGCGAVLFGGLTYAAVLAVRALLADPQVAVVVGVAVAVVLLSVRILGPWMDRLFDQRSLVPVLVTPAPLRSWYGEVSSEEALKQEAFLNRWMLRSGDLGDVQPGDDPDVSTSTDGAPARAGVTEIALSLAGGQLDEVERHLKTVRAFHIGYIVVVGASFLVTFSLVVYASLFGDADAVSTLLGGSIGAVLGAFTVRLLSLLRTTQISLALYQSFVIDLQQSLSEAEAEEDPQSRRALRREAWMAFRRGLNELWRDERSRRFGQDEESG